MQSLTPHYGLLKKLDRSVLTIWICAECLHAEAARKVREIGLLTKSSATGAPIQNPYLKILNKQALILIRAAAELGFSPASRSRVTVLPGTSRSRFDGLIV